KCDLFVVACCRRIWHLLTDHRIQSAVETAERYADGQATEEKLFSAAQEATNVVCAPQQAAARYAPKAAMLTVSGNPVEPWGTASVVASTAARAVARDPVRKLTEEEWASARAVERKAQADLVREIIRNPFRPLTVDPSWVTPTVRTLAQ